MNTPDDLDDYLRRGSGVSREYQRQPMPLPPPALDRRVLRLARETQGNSPCLAPLAFAACVLLSVALVLALVFGPQTAKRADDTPRVVRAAARAESPANALSGRGFKLYSSDPQRARAPAAWLARIAALRRAGRDGEADAEFRRFRGAYPNYPNADPANRP